MPFARIGLDRVLRDGQDDDRHAEPRPPGSARRAGRPLTRPWSSASTMTMSGRSWPICGDDLRAVGQDVEELDERLRVEQAADVLRDLGHVLDDEEAVLGATELAIGAECTTAGGVPGRPRRSLARGAHGDEDRAVAAGAGAAPGRSRRRRLDLAARRPRRSAAQLVGRRRSRRRSARIQRTGGVARAALLVDRGQVDDAGGRVVERRARSS